MSHFKAHVPQSDHDNKVNKTANALQPGNSQDLCKSAPIIFRIGGK